MVFAATVDKDAAKTRAGDDAAKVGWFALDSLPPLAFDHRALVEQIIKHIR
jgi:8-oxo-dGTP diphosphatase